jgi:UDP-glucose 4-epimerase
MRVIVTGGAGFIGSHLVDGLVARGDEVHVVDDLSNGKRENVGPGAMLHVRDVRDPLDDLVAETRPEAIAHLAAQVDVRVSVAEPVRDASVNVVGTVNVLEAARTAGARVVFASTGGAIYGECERPAREDDPRLPLSPYGTSKLAGEEYLASFSRLHGAAHVSLRFGNVYGPRQDPHGEAGVVAIFLGRLRDGETCRIFGDGTQTRDYVFVGDVVQAVTAALDTPEAGTFNVGTGTETSVLGLYEACRVAAGSDAPAVHEPERAGELACSVLDPSLAERRLGFRAATPLAHGVARTWEWLGAPGV